MIVSPESKQSLRRRMRAARLAFWQSLPERHRALIFSRPPAFVLPLLKEAQTIGLYAPLPGEVPTRGYAMYLMDQGMRLALPWFADRDAPMLFRSWTGLEEELVEGPFGAHQPSDAMPLAEPDALFLPLLAFDATLNRLGQGGGHYDRYLAERPHLPRLGLAWSIQQVETVPGEPHDQRLDAVITEQRAFMRQEGQD